MLLLVVFIIIIGSATFIENTFDTATAKLLIYHAIWFEFLMLGLVVLFMVTTSRKNLFSKEKLPQLIFHFSFIVLIIGGGITRYFGFEANMHIFQNETSKVLYTAEPYFQVRIVGNNIDYSSPDPLYFSQIQNNNFNIELKVNKDDNLTIDFRDYIYEAKELFAKNHKKSENNVQFVPDTSGQKSPDALIVAITYKGKVHEAVLFYDDTKYIQPFKPFLLDDLQIELVYGPKPITLPFALKLDKFTLSKYPGSNYPSASESKVVLIDNRVNLKETHLIAKNKVLDYDGYRFFQTAYDDDEKGTILSVNYDYYGTRVTYFGYLLMAIGSLLILFSKKSYFSQLDTQIKRVREKRKSLMMSALLIIGIQGFGFSQHTIQNPISKDHAENFGHIIVQTYDGRFSSVHSLATDVIHKISGKDFFDIERKGRMGATQIFLDMHVDPEFWKSQKMIMVREQSLRDLIGTSGKYASFYDLEENGYYKLEKLYYKAYQKKAADQSAMDREIIKVTERINIFLMTINGTSLKLFPEQSSTNYTWISWDDALAVNPLNENLIKIDIGLQAEGFNYRNIMRSYFIATINARATDDYTIPNQLIANIKSIQRQLTPAELLPSETKIALEVIYHKSKIFDYLKYIYLLLGIGLLVLTFIQNFKNKPSKRLLLSVKIFVAFTVFAFIFQTLGMGLRWYLSDHAPWSNGYEVLLLTAWGVMLAGFYVINYSKITLASTAILAFFILMTANHSYYDPQLTNLEPVLKSYWLIIHVAIITIGFAFLALSFILGVLNILIYLINPSKKTIISSLVIEELTYINEKLLTIGMFLTAIGTFIGCVWANESWGTYWSWNAKQTWSLIIILVYGVVLHFKFIPKMKSLLTFNIGAVISFGSVIMTFVGVNYYFTKGLHSYASDDPPIFPIWAWVSIMILVSIIVGAIIKENYRKKEGGFN